MPHNPMERTIPLHQFVEKICSEGANQFRAFDKWNYHIVEYIGLNGERISLILNDEDVTESAVQDWLTTLDMLYLMEFLFPPEI